MVIFYTKCSLDSRVIRTPFDLFYADNPTGATRSVNGLGRNVGIKRLSAYR